MGSKGINNKSFTLWEELELRVSTDSGKVAIYKKTYNDKRQGRTPLPIEDRSYFVHIPVPNTKGGIRKSLLTKDRTTLVIAHRLSTVMNSKTICVVDNGKIIAEGNHAELLQKSDIYKNFYEKQLRKD